MDHTVKILKKEHLTHDVLKLTLEKPDGFRFTAGQAVEMTLDDPSLKQQRSPFTLTNLDGEPHLEFILKIYPQHKGMTLAISKKEPGEYVIISDAWDSFRNNGPGIFIAGGTGITPFIAILRQLNIDGKVKGSRLFFSNKTAKDIFLGDELQAMLGEQYINVLTREPLSHKNSGRIDLNFLKAHVASYAQPFYICGPQPFVDQVNEYLLTLGVTREMVSLSF